MNKIKQIKYNYTFLISNEYRPLKHNERFSDSKRPIYYEKKTIMFIK